MHTIKPISKTLKSAIPTIRIQDSVVKSWEIEVFFEYEGDEIYSPWEMTHVQIEDVEHLNKVALAYTQSELLDMINLTFENETYNEEHERYRMPIREDVLLALGLIEPDEPDETPEE